MKNILALLLLLAGNSVYAQDTPNPIRKNTIFFEIGGNSFLYSLNYDRLLVKKPNWGLAGRIGGSYLRDTGVFENTDNHFYAVPLELSLLVGKSNHQLEIGAGATPFYKDYQEESGKDNWSSVAPNARIGYRYQKSDGGLFFKAGFTPLIAFKKDYNSINPKHVYPWAGLAFGYTI
ncbi:hypothetical protein [Rufibacter aurantiacus]|uniref:hypothetical protein n=1 Tax=Rufibacter aurantiacus TaxID=2817374 RepID=UPI001B314FC0|nr:hypothetical protein [Rufibacter aurantiacus]